MSSPDSATVLSKSALCRRCEGVIANYSPHPLLLASLDANGVPLVPYREWTEILRQHLPALWAKASALPEMSLAAASVAELIIDAACKFEASLSRRAATDAADEAADEATAAADDILRDDFGECVASSLTSGVYTATDMKFLRPLTNTLVYGLLACHPGAEVSRRCVGCLPEAETAPCLRLWELVVQDVGTMAQFIHEYKGRAQALVDVHAERIGRASKALLSGEVLASGDADANASGDADADASASGIPFDDYRVGEKIATERRADAAKLDSQHSKAWELAIHFLDFLRGAPEVTLASTADICKKWELERLGYTYGINNNYFCALAKLAGSWRDDLANRELLYEYLCSGPSSERFQAFAPGMLVAARAHLTRMREAAEERSAAARKYWARK